MKTFSCLSVNVIECSGISTITVDFGVLSFAASDGTKTCIYVVPAGRKPDKIILNARVFYENKPEGEVDGV